MMTLTEALAVFPTIVCILSMIAFAFGELVHGSRQPPVPKL